LIVDFFWTVDADAGPDLVSDEVVVDGAVDEGAVGEEADVEAFAFGVFGDLEDVWACEWLAAFDAEPADAEVCYLVDKVESFFRRKFMWTFGACGVYVAVFASCVTGTRRPPRSHE
jgi:hypothetical protein